MRHSSGVILISASASPENTIYSNEFQELERQFAGLPNAEQ